jgi:putative ABC transport system ATP-binding protein
VLVSWAPGVAARQFALPRGVVARDVCSGAYPSIALPRNNALKRSYSHASGPIASRSLDLLRHPAGIARPVFQNTSPTPIFDQVRFLCSTPRLLEAKSPTKRPEVNNNRAHEQEDEDTDKGFELSEKGTQAAQVNLRARLAKDGAGGKKGGFGEVWRLIMIARPEAKTLALAIFFLLISSSITMSIPFSIGKIMDTATKSTEEGGGQLFGLSLPMFYSALAGILTVGAAANYGRIIILRIVGERIVARLRSKLYRQTFIQDAEFFDANRVGDLISRLSSDTIIVGKSITQNLSDGLRAGVSGAAGFGMMAYVSLKLSSVLAILLPPMGLGAFFYGRAIRNLSRKIQKNLGSLTKIAEERLGNVKTSQSFGAETLEVGRYHKQVRKIFELGKRESLISASFFSSVCSIVSLVM